MQKNILVLRHRKAMSFSYGGPVYAEAVLSLIAAAFPQARFRELCFFQDQQQGSSALSKARSLLLSLFSPLPAKVRHFSSAAFRDEVRQTLAADGYALVIINGIDMLWCAPLIPNDQPILYLSHNIEHLLYGEQIARPAAIPLLGAVLRRDLRKLAELELSGAARADRIVTISADDGRALRQRLPDGAILTIPPFFTYPPFEKAARDPGAAPPIHLGFLGNLAWWPNRKAVQWFLDHVWPALPRERYRLHLFGKDSGMFNGDGLIAHGYVADLETVWTTCDIMIQPIVAGGGINLKVAETLYNRMPTLATPMALRGMDLQDDPAIVRLRDATDWKAFLSSPGPEQLCRLRVSPRNAALFAQGDKPEKIKDFLAPFLAER